MPKGPKGRAIIADAIKLLAHPENKAIGAWWQRGRDFEDSDCHCIGGAIIKAAKLHPIQGDHNGGTVGRTLCEPPTHAANDFERVVQIADQEAKRLGFANGIIELNDKTNYEGTMAYLHRVQELVNADPWFRRSTVRKTGTEKYYQRARRALRKQRQTQSVAAV